MYYLIYSSRSTTDWEDSELDALLKISVKNNAKVNITGLLIFVRDRFVQMLEGDEEQVLALYEKISEDPRHNHVNILLSGNHFEEQRLFPDWSMAYRKLTLNEFMTISGYQDLESLFLHQSIDDRSHPALVFLKHFTKQALKETIQQGQ